VNLNDYRPVPFYFINTTDPAELDRKAAREAMQALKAGGFGGLVFFNKPPTGFSAEEYLEDFWFEVTENFLLAARDLDLQFWINDGFNFPPGDAAGRIEKRQPDLHQQYLWLEEDGRVSVRKADWGFPAFEEKESSQLFIELVYEEYRKRLGKYFGNGITGFFSDADNRRCNFSTTKILGGRQYFPWSRHFGEEFRRRFGYALEPHLPALLKGEATPQVRRDYWQLTSDLYQQWFANNYQWCRQHGLKYSFHTSDTGPLSWQECPRSSVFSEGQPLKLLQHADIPGTDHELLALDGGTHFDARLFWPKVSFGGDDQKLHNPEFSVSKFDLRAKYAASAAFLGGKKRALCEAFAATNWGADHSWLRRIAAWQILQGINFFVPHAVHHRVHGSTKYFAPPEFLYGSLRHGLREFNDWLAHFCQVASQGDYIAEIAVLDPTEQIWDGRTNTSAFFELCDRLNRQLRGYVIAADSSDAAKFPHCIDAFAPEHGSLPEAPFSSDVLAFMPRRLADGSKFLLLGNVWGDTLWRGSIPFDGKNYELELYPGELAVLGGPWEQYRKPVKLPVLRELDGPFQVHWESPNRIPLRKSCCWSNNTDIPGMTIQVPIALRGAVLLDQQPLEGGEPTRVFDDPYWCYTVAGSAGTHALTIPESIAFSEPVYLCGDFEVHLTTQQDFHRSVFRFYHLELFEPESFTLELSPRKNQLLPGSWADQGAPFYSGTVTYDLEAELDCPNVRLELPEVAGTCEVLWQNQPLERRIWAPYHFDLGEWRGKQHLQVRVHNTLANQLEAYRAPSGILKPPRLLERIF